ncbi:Arginyl-tRNA--protein transferase 1 [Plakobranchus ocellatus]|uniref:Arginyl-tRNA--protein transferase 1 n=1 Tax=Plakobranchus ocellatus TaxID=259542 RepID=A0AAV4BYK6_9GAST|nr:Arginyl-tRNA--protein transferase 1 [Plakobranchus ocellatus]
MFVRELQRESAALQYYYMGFYIHSCPKMKYKAQFNPSDLVCPQSYQWVPVPQCLPKLDVSPYSRLAEAKAEDKNKDVDVNQVLVLHRRKVLPYALYKLMNSEASDEATVKEYAGFVGKTCAEHHTDLMLICLCVDLVRLPDNRDLMLTSICIDLVRLPDYTDLMLTSLCVDLVRLPDYTDLMLTRLCVDLVTLPDLLAT